MKCSKMALFFFFKQSLIVLKRLLWTCCFFWTGAAAAPSIRCWNARVDLMMAKWTHRFVFPLLYLCEKPWWAWTKCTKPKRISSTLSFYFDLLCNCLFIDFLGSANQQYKLVSPTCSLALSPLCKYPPGCFLSECQDTVTEEQFLTRRRMTIMTTATYTLF